MYQSRRFVVTGGPGAGKSTLIAALGEGGASVFEEAGRAILRLSDAVGGPAHAARDPQRYAEAMLLWDLRSWAEAEGCDDPCLFDRGVPDTIGYLRLMGLPVPAHMQRAARMFRYEDPVFVAPPWPEIYTTDAERTQGFDLAVSTHDCIRAVYEELGYAVAELPLAPVADRVAFVLRRCG